MYKRQDDQNHLVGIHERTRIENHGGQAEYTEDDGATWTGLPQETIVSMNLSLIHICDFLRCFRLYFKTGQPGRI